MSENYMRDRTVRESYDFWIRVTSPPKETPHPLGHPADNRLFYAFVKACVQWAGGKDVRRKLDTSILRLHLYDDLHSKLTEEGYDKITSDIIIRFETLLDYEDAVFP